MWIALWLALWAAPAQLVPALAQEGFRVLDLDTALIALVDSGGDARPHAERVRARYERAVQVVRQRLGLTGPPRPYIIECPSAHRMRELTAMIAGAPAPDYADAVAVPAANVMLLVPSMELGADLALLHETAHLALHGRFARIPRWIDEGLAQWAAGQVPGEAELRTLRYWAFRNGVFPFGSLEDELPRRHELASFAYVQSYSVVEYLAMRRGGTGLLLEVVERAQSEPLGAAWKKVYGETAETTWEKWRRLEAGNFSLTGFLVHDIPLFTYLAVLVLIGYARYLVKRRRFLRAEELEDLPAEGPDEGEGREPEGEQPPERP